MNNRDKKFRMYFFLIVASVFLLFCIMLILQWEKVSLIDNFLTSASVAGFFGMFGQFALSLIQEYYARKSYRVCMICKQSQFSSVLCNGIQK